MSATARLLPDGRLHLHHGPMDILVEVWGTPDAVRDAYHCVARRFAPLLDELVAELPGLRAADGRALDGCVARAMGQAVSHFRPAFITPMAAVAGAVADELLQAARQPGVRRAYINNGGDIAVHLAAGEQLTAAIATPAGLHDRVTLHSHARPRGLATSGWRGRSFSLGIADAVSILAPTAAMADAAATIIANAVDLPGHPAVTRRPANSVKSDSDLGAKLVTVDVGPLSRADVARALAAGLAAARHAHAAGLIDAAALFLQGQRVLYQPARAPHFLPQNIPGGSGRAEPSRRVAPAGGETFELSPDGAPTWPTFAYAN